MENKYYLYDILLSVFLGIVCVILFNQLFDSPRVVNIYLTN